MTSGTLTLLVRATSIAATCAAIPIAISVADVRVLRGEGVAVDADRPLAPAVTRAAALARFSEIVGLRAKVQVRRIHADAVVAGMQDLETIRDRAMGEDPGVPMCEDRRVASSPVTARGPAVAGATVHTPEPVPTTIRSADLAPEQSGFGKSKVDARHEVKYALS